MQRKEEPMSRKIADCRDFPSENGCTLTIAGEEDEVIAAAAHHAAAVHGHEDNDDLRTWLKSSLKDEALS
jgi:predicted small metal-binding protein